MSNCLRLLAFCQILSLEVLLALMAIVFLVSMPHRSEAGMYLTPNPWQKNEVSVCFADRDDESTPLSLTTESAPSDERRKILGNWGANLRNKVRDLINTEYTSAKTGIAFNGWQMCGDVAADDIDTQIFISTSDANKISRTAEYGRASIGPNLQYGSNSERKSFVFFQHPEAMTGDFKLKQRIGDSSIYWEATVIHEFGHLAGLLHEHEQPSIAQDPNCQKEFKEDLPSLVNEMNQVKIINLEQFLLEDDGGPTSFNVKVQHGNYDSKSVMNYCYINREREERAGKKIGLSAA